MAIHSGLGGRIPGAHLGIPALEMDTEAASFFKKCRWHNLAAPEISEEEQSFQYARKARAICALLKDIRTETEQLLSSMQNSSLLFVFSGDHSSAAGVIMGLREACQPEKVGVIWIDAHADLQTPYATGSGNLHGMPLSIVFREDNMAQKVNVVSEAEVHYWHKMKVLHPPTAQELSLASKALVFIGLRDTDPAEDYLLKKYKIPVISVETVRKRGAQWAVTQALSHLSGCERLYVSFDVDSLDPALSVGTGTPAPHGLTLEEAIALNRGLVASSKTKVWEITEINPLLDTKNAMAQAGSAVLKEVVVAYEER